MTIDELRTKVREWDLRANPGSQVAEARYSYILDELEHHAEREWQIYLPAAHCDFSSNYLDRLSLWIGNVSNEEEQKLLLEYARYVSFFSEGDFYALYQTAFNREILRWIAQLIGCQLDKSKANQFDRIIKKQIHQTWFCPMTDSMDINKFCKINHIKGGGFPHAIVALHKLATDERNPDPNIVINLKNFMACPNGNLRDPSPPLERLVLLEDVVGSSSQCVEALNWIMENIKKPVLFIPLILCPNGSRLLHTIENHWNGLLKVCPIIELSRNDLLGPERQKNKGWPISDAVERLAEKCARGPLNKLGPFGFADTGCSIATFSNTPDNTLPIVHNKPAQGGWEPLFPRIARETI